MALSPTESALPLAEAQRLWSPARPYLNTASYGLPPAPAWAELMAALEDWRHGRTSWEAWTESTERARRAFARLVGTRSEDVATGDSASQLVALVAASLPSGARVLAPERDFASLLFPLAVRAEVTTVPLARLADSVEPGVALVALSAVQSATGEVADVRAVAAAARAQGALVLVDATHAVGWLPIAAADVDYLVCAAYKWLLSPRGTAFLAVRPGLLERVPALAANWWSSDDPYGTYYGLPIRLAEDARRLDTSPAWFSWVGAAPALELLERIGVGEIHRHDVALANRFRAGLGLPPGDCAIVSVERAGAEERLARAGILASVRAGSLRASFHLYNTEADVDAALAALL
ncbi:MAG: aminotransferase class V-fold PLP-dependent enzyme [Thermoleophilia bacterium]|nr:aminotransferase class V-fold PLP-dependent enzyme [Thermoleophilia bacterium]